MEDQEILAKIEKILKEGENDWGIPKNSIINSKTKLRETKNGLNMDSLDAYELAYSVGKTFDITVEDKDIGDINTIEDYINYIKARIN
jgi:acyl carrier protein